MPKHYGTATAFAPTISLAWLILLTAGAADVFSAEFTPLDLVPRPKITAVCEPYPGDSFTAGHLIDGNPRSEFSSNAKGTNTFVELDFGTPISLAAFKHVDRNDPATVAASELRFLDDTGNTLATFSVRHVNQRGGTTLFTLPEPVTARRVRWQITGLGSSYSTVGGAEISFFRRGTPEQTPARVRLEARLPELLERKGRELMRPVHAIVHYPYLESCSARLQVAGAEPKELQLSFGDHIIDFSVQAEERESPLHLSLVAGPKNTAIQHTTSLKPVRQREIYILPHSHVDIGYTALQADVEKKQNENLVTGMRLARATAGYPEGSRFVWNVEVLWPVDNYLRSATAEERAAFLQAVKSGQVGLDAFYCNVLTGLCRPEELLNLMRYATQLAELCGVPIESAMISDVPGYTWSTVTAMAQAGVKYFSFAPNYFDRMGGTMKEWQNRPFWWKSPDGRHRVLCWCPSRGYALGHIIGDGAALTRFLPDYLVELETNSYPYEISHLRWNVHGDNGSPDEKVAEVIRDWNARYVYPRLVISTTADAFRAFERRYGSSLPEFSGDYTPYWEDGAASSARETALNRASAERLVQAAALWSLRNPAPFPAADFQEAWRNVLLYSEHTWGAHNSISQPDLPFVRDQWSVKQAFALDAAKQSRALLRRALENAHGAEGRAGVLEVFNTGSWPRTDVVTVSASLSTPGDRVLDEHGKNVPSQRLSTGELAFLARKVPPFSSARFRVVSGPCPGRDQVEVEGNTLTSPEYVVRIDEKTGSIGSLFSRRLKRELAEADSGLNSYLYLPGSDVKGIKGNGPSKLTVTEKGPLIAAVRVESEAPGCKKLLREIRLIAGLDRVEIIDTIDKLAVRSKEGVHFAFAFDVPGAMPRFDVGFATVRPELDQIPAACKNWFSVQRWVDISNEKYGVTWSPIDAPLVELGGLTANLVGSQTDHRVWVQQLEPSSRIYSWVMNNHWHTNYRADQEGPTVFRFAVRAHKGFEPEEAAMFGTECSQPLIGTIAASGGPAKSRLRLSSDEVIITALKPSDDAKADIVRLFGASGKPQRVRLHWSDPAPRQVWISDLSEKPAQPAGNSIEVPGWGLVTLRAER